MTPMPSPSTTGSDLLLPPPPPPQQQQKQQQHENHALATSPLWGPLHRAISARIKEQQQSNQQYDRSHIPTVTMPSTFPPPLADFLVTVPSNTGTPHQPGIMMTSKTSTTTVAHICLTADHDMDTLLTQESSRIVKCAQKYGPSRVTILLMVQPGHLSCLQTLEHFLLNKMPSLDPTPTVATPHWLSIASTTTSTLAPVSVWGKPNAIACHSPEDTTDYLSKVLAPSPTHSSSTAPPYGQISQYDHQNHNSNTSKPTWLSAALVTTGSPLLSAQDANRLRQGLGTIQNAVLATPVQFQNTCLLNQHTSKAIHDFFNTDQPI